MEEEVFDEYGRFFRFFIQAILPILQLKEKG